MPQDKINAFMTLYTTLVTFAKLAAPMIPFMTDDIYRNLVCSIDKSAPISVHLCDYPVCNEAWIDTELESNMDKVLATVVLGRACRNSANVKNRQPISLMYVKADFMLHDFYSDIIRDELNVKKVEFTSDVSKFTSYTFKPQLRTVGPKYGKYLGQIRTKLSTLDGNSAMNELNTTGILRLDLGDTTAELTADDLLIDSANMPGYEAVSDRGITVVLDTNLTPELIEEGFVREVVSKIQTMRKDSGFDVMDNINVYVSGNERIAAIVRRNAESIIGDVLGIDIFYDRDGAQYKDWNLNGEDVKLAVEKITK